MSRINLKMFNFLHTAKDGADIRGHGVAPRHALPMTTFAEMMTFLFTDEASDFSNSPVGIQYTGELTDSEIKPSSDSEKADYLSPHIIATSLIVHVILRRRYQGNLN